MNTSCNVEDVQKCMLIKQIDENDTSNYDSHVNTNNHKFYENFEMLHVSGRGKKLNFLNTDASWTLQFNS